MNLRHLTAIALAAASCAAQAAPVDINNPQLRLNLGGASALRNSMAGLVTNDLCGGTASNPDIRFYNTNGTSSFTNNRTGTAVPSNFWAITCPLPAAGAAKLGVPTGTTFAFFKTDAGGSAQGVFPIAAGGNANRPFMSTADCAPRAGSSTISDCNGTAEATMHFGVSDVEPAMFKELNVPDDSLDPDVPGYSTSGPDTTGMTVTPVVQTLFAVAVNVRLYQEMFDKQGLSAKKEANGAACTSTSSDENCIPSIGYAEARALFQGTETNWKLLARGTSALLDSQVNICRRVQGSGTQAAANAHLMGSVCNSNALTPARWFNSTTDNPLESSSFLNAMVDGTPAGLSFTNYLTSQIPTVGPDSNGRLFVFEGPGTGNVTACLARAETAGGFAIGHVSKENDQTGTSWRHVKLEGAYPARDNARVGKYDYTVESTMQYRAGELSGLVATAVPRFIAEVAKPDALVRLSTTAQNGVAALPTSYTATFAAATGNAAIFGSRVTRNGNTCQPMVAVK